MRGGSKRCPQTMLRNASDVLVILPKQVGVLEPCEDRLCVTCPGLIWHLLLPG